MCSGDVEELRRRIYDALRGVMDPEIGLSVVDAGFIRNVLIDQEGNVTIEMILTTPFCPLTYVILAMVKNAAEQVEGVKEAEVRIIGYEMPQL